MQTVQETAAQTTVYLQYDAMPLEQADAIARALIRDKFKVPGPERQKMPESGLLQVRYYWPSDKAEADRLAQSARNVLKSQGVDFSVVQVQDLTGWTRTKPRSGVLELWIGLPVGAK